MRLPARALDAVRLVQHRHDEIAAILETPGASAMKSCGPFSASTRPIAR